MYTPLFAGHTDVPTLIITANQRLSTQLKLGYDNYMAQQTQSQSWASLNCESIETWLMNLLYSMLDLGLSQHCILSPRQEIQLWEDIINQSEVGKQFLNIHACAKSAQKAWQLCQQWHINPLEQDRNSFAEDLDSSQFLLWCEAFKAACEQEAYLTSGERYKHITDRLANHPKFQFQQILLVGFTELSPAEKKLFSALENLNYTVSQYQAAGHQAPTLRHEFYSPQAEIHAMAQWAMAEHLTEPKAVIHCVVPGLDQRREVVLEVFTQYCRDNFTQHINISGGQSLADFALIKTAQRVLALLQTKIDCLELGQVLLSPYIMGGTEEYHQRAMLDEQLRQLEQSHINFKQLEYLSENYLESCPKWWALLKIIAEIKNQLPKQATLSQWANYFSQLLHAVHWPGERPLSSLEYQVHARWQSLLSELDELDLVAKTNFNFYQASSLLTRSLNETLFQAQSPNASIQVLNTLEAIGLACDKLWFMGLDDHTWPSAPQPNPFIPISLQKEKNIPQSSADRELYYAKTVIEKYQQFTQNTVIYSHAKEVDGRDYIASPLITQYPITEHNLIDFNNFNLNCSEIIYIKDTQGKPLDNTARGGSAVFKYQALCPFRAYGQFRLDASQLASPSSHLSPAQRGIILHKILQILWQKLECSDNLHKLSEVKLNNLTKTVIIQQLNYFRQYYGSGLDSLFFDIEQSRLQTLILNWFNYEKSRQAFTVIATEHPLELTFENMQIKLQVDRIDKLADGRHIIIDYKTNRPNISDWFTDYPLEPQLPLYAVCYKLNKNPEIAGLSFAQIRSDESRFRGIATDKKILPDIDYISAEELQNQIGLWHDALAKLAYAYQAGEAAVDPLQPMSCQYCHLHTLCRINNEGAHE